MNKPTVGGYRSGAKPVIDITRPPASVVRFARPAPSPAEVFITNVLAGLKGARPHRPDPAHGMRVFSTRPGRWAFTCTLCQPTVLTSDGWRSWHAAMQGMHLHRISRRHQEAA